MRVVVSTTGGTGHIRPVVPVAAALRRAGHDVRWVTTPSGLATVEAFGFDARPAGMPLEERIAAFFQRHPEVFTMPPRERRPTMFAGMFAELAAPAASDAIAAVLDDVRPDLVVHEVAELAAPPLADARDIPRLTVAFSGRLPQAVQERVAPEVAPLWDAVGLEMPDELGLYRGTYLHPFPPSMGQRPTAHGVVDVRPTDPDEERPSDPPAWLATMGVDRPLVYLTYGTELGALAPWEVLVTGLASLDVDVVVTVGGGDTAAVAAFVPPSAGHRVRVERFVPQRHLLARASVVVSHAGAGSVLGAAAAGVAQLLLPAAADQFDNADALDATGAALVADVPTLTSEAVADHVDRLLHDAAFAASASQLAAEIAAMPSIDDVVGTAIPGP